VSLTRAYTLPSWAKKGLRTGAHVIVAVVASCAKAQAAKYHIPVGPIVNKIKKFVNGKINQWLARRLWGWHNVTNFVHKAAAKVKTTVHKAAGVAKKVGHVVGKVANVAKQGIKVANKLSGGRLCKTAANLGCPLLTKAILAAAASQGIPTQMIPACLTNVVTNGCKSLIQKICARRLYELQVKRITSVLKKQPGQVRRTFLIPGFIKKGLRKAAGTIVKVLSSCAKKQAKKFGLPVGGIIKTVTKLINGVLDKLLKRRLGFFSWISNAVKKVGHFVAKAVKTGVKFANKLSGGMLCKAAANFGCPAAIQLLKTVATQVHIPPQMMPGCMTDILRDECKKLILVYAKEEENF